MGIRIGIDLGGTKIELIALDGSAAEIFRKRVPLPRPEDLPLPDCYCGRKGCIEAYLSGPALQRDPDMDRYEERLARALAGVINILDPDVIVLGGGISNLQRLYAK